MISKDTRLGRFSIHAALLSDVDDKIIRRVMGSCIIMEAKYNIMTDIVEYLAWSPYFHPIEYGQEAPEYEVSMYDSENIKFIPVGNWWKK